MQLPMELSGITKDWVEEALSTNRDPVRLEAMETLEVIHGAATKIRIKLTYAAGTSQGLPETMWIKIGFEPHHEFVETILSAYTAEVVTYNDVIPLYDLDTPKCYFAQAQKSPAQGVVFLEDLRLRDVEFNHVLKPLSVAQVASGLEALAKQHGQSWGDPRLQEIKTMNDPLRGAMQRVFEDFVDDSEKYFTDLRGYAVPIELHDKDRLGRGLQAYMKHAGRGPQCFLHADTHVGNSFTEKDGSVHFLDWQMACRGHWSHDVAHFIGSALDVTDRRNAEHDLIAHYLKHLGNAGGDAPSLPDAWDDYRRAIYYGFIVWLGNADGWQIPQINLCNFTRFGYAMIDHNTYDLLGV